MPSILPGRHIASPGSDLTVFLIGARINRWWKIGTWLPVARAFSRMLRELEASPELGLLGHQSWAGRTTISVQYWRSKDALLAYARAHDSAHLPAWRAFNQRVRKHAGDIGLWHEMYPVAASAAHTMYVDMPAFGLGRAVGSRAAARGHGPQRAPGSAAA